MSERRLNKNITASSRIKTNPLRDEFYTTEETADIFIESLPDGILDGKAIYCNCDGPESEIYKKLKKQYK
jgi:hypothetical protein